MRSGTLIFALATAAATAMAGGALRAQQTPPEAARQAAGQGANPSSVTSFPSTASAIERGATRGNLPDSQPAKRRDRGAHPLEQLASQRILVLPVQTAIFADSLGWGSQISSIRSYLQTLDDEITFALKERGLEGKWVLSEAVVRSARRNADFAADPHAIDTRQLRPGVKTDDFLLREPMASQLRSLIALTDARFVLIPVQVRIDNVFSPVESADARKKQPLDSSAKVPRAHATLRIAIIDARRSQLQWAGDVTGISAASFSPAIAADLASRLADLIAPSN